jgi:hypothetical protein
MFTLLPRLQMLSSETNVHPKFGDAYPIYVDAKFRMTVISVSVLKIIMRVTEENTFLISQFNCP